VAKKGNLNAHHFAHYNRSDCNHGAETALHIMAKNIVAQSKKIWVPVTPKNVYGHPKTGKVVLFEKAELEKQLSDTVRSDILLSNGDRYLNVEIHVTHEVDIKKQIELFNLGITTIEISLGDMISSFTPELITRRLLNGSHTTLMFSSKCKAIFAKQMLGEWKDFCYDGQLYVEDCPLTRKRAYFVDYMRRGSTECHECSSATECIQDEERLLCRGVLDRFDFDGIEKILCIEKEENHLRHVKILMADGSIFEKRFK
jgi:hypothetical protein